MGSIHSYQGLHALRYLVEQHGAHPEAKSEKQGTGSSIQQPFLGRFWLGEYGHSFALGWNVRPGSARELQSIHGPSATKEKTTTIYNDTIFISMRPSVSSSRRRWPSLLYGLRATRTSSSSDHEAPQVVERSTSSIPKESILSSSEQERALKRASSIDLRECFAEDALSTSKRAP